MAVLNAIETEISPYSQLSTDTLDYYPFGGDNLFPQAMALFSRTSPNHRGVLNSKRIYTLGRDITTEDEAFNKGFLESCNFEEERFHDVLDRVEHDWLTTGNGWFEMITDRRGSFLWINHLDSTKCRLAKNGKEVYLHPDWSKYTGRSDKNKQALPLFPNWTAGNTQGVATIRTVYHLKSYEPEFVNYGIPYWIAGKDAIQIDLKTNRWNLARLVNAFKISGIMFVPVKDKNESAQVLQRLKRDHTGDMNQEKLMVVTKARATENEKADQVQLIESNKEDRGSWLELHNMGLGDILVAHSWYRALTSLPDNTGFDTQRILNEYNVALSTYIQPRQNTIQRLINKLFKKIVNTEVDLMFINKPPVDTDDGMMLWEIRRDKGLDYDENDERQQRYIYNGSIID